MVVTHLLARVSYRLLASLYTSLYTSLCAPLYVCHTGEDQVTKSQWDMLYTVLTVTPEPAQGPSAPSRTLVYRCPPDSRVYPHVAVACHLGLKNQLNKPQGA